MRIRKFILCLSSVFSFALISESVLALDPSTYSVNPIQISGLRAIQEAAPKNVQNNLYVTAYYGVGRRASLNNQGDQINLRRHKAKLTFKLNGDRLELPTVKFKRSNFFVSFNIVIFVVHVGSQFTWVNADGKLADGDLDTNQHYYWAVDSLTLPEFESLLQKQSPKNGQALRYNFGSRVPEEI